MWWLLERSLSVLADWLLASSLIFSVCTGAYREEENVCCQLKKLTCLGNLLVINYAVYIVTVLRTITSKCKPLNTS